jgi:hypothetical protein
VSLSVRRRREAVVRTPMDRVAADVAAEVQGSVRHGTRWVVP